jgi:nickel-dependent lactate racemase
MKISLPFGDKTTLLEVALPPEQIRVAESKNPGGSDDWAKVVEEAMGEPIGAEPIHRQNLKGKRVAIITDDITRPTAAWAIIPLLLAELKQAGAAEADITFIIASGMHPLMTREEMAAKLGPDIVARFRCLPHDGGDRSNLAFLGFSAQGTPVWTNRWVAEADYKIAVSRIYPHISHGYEGGYKIILPGVSGYDTIVRNHEFSFAADCFWGSADNPNRREVNAVGQMVGLDYLINVVTNSRKHPIKAFCGEAIEVHRQGVRFGDREVWGAEVGEAADIVVTSPGRLATRTRGYSEGSLIRAARVCKPGGWVICQTPEEITLDLEEGGETAAEGIYRAELEEFKAALKKLSLLEIMRLHEYRAWPLEERDIQWRIKFLRSEYYHRRNLQILRERKLALTPNPQAALEKALAQVGSKDIRVLVIPEGKQTLPKTKLL